MQKIFVDKNEALADVLRYVKSSTDEVVMLVIPTDSKFKTITSFRTLKKKSAEIGKSIAIESVDEKVLSMANSANLEAVHPFLNSRNNRTMADIIPAPKKPKAAREVIKKEPARKKPPYILHVKGSSEKEVPIPVNRKNYIAPSSWNFPWRYVIPIGVFLFILLGGLAVNIFFTKAEIVINFERKDWELNHNFVASTSVPKEGGSSFAVPGQLLRQQKNIAQLFPASGRGQVSQKATAKITIYNAYSEDSQLLVKSTRFQTPDGKIFRTDTEVVVPGATKQDGKLVPSSIKVNATAAEAGPSYNVGPFPKLTIPGFKGTSRYDGFYGAMEEVATGGFIGERAVATDADVTAAQEKATQMFKAAFENTFLASAPQGLKIIDGASELRIIKISVDKNVNAEGQFTVFGEAEFRGIVFREEDLKKLLDAQAEADFENSKFESLIITYGLATPDYNSGQMTFSVKANGSLVPDFNPDDFKSKVVGRSEKEVKSMVLGIPHLKDAKISLLPFWAKRVPDNKDRVIVVVK